MLNKELLLATNKNIHVWEGTIFPDIYQSPIYDSMGNPTGRTKWVLQYGSGYTHTGIFLENTELSQIQMDTSRSDFSVAFWFWDTVHFPRLYVKRADRSAVYSYRKDTVFDSAYRDDDYQGFF